MPTARPTAFAADITLYAQWTTLPTRTVTFNSQRWHGHDGTAGSQRPDGADDQHLHAGGLLLRGWNTNAGGTGTAYANGATYSFAADITLYAQWTALPMRTVTFNANGGTGTMAPQTANVPTALTLNTFTRGGLLVRRLEHSL